MFGSLRHVIIISAVLGAAPSLVAAPLRTSPGSIETVSLPPSVRDGVDTIYIDAETQPDPVKPHPSLESLVSGEKLGAPLDLLAPMNHLYTDLRRGLIRYRQRWASLPQLTIPAGPTLRQGQTGERVALLRERLGLAGGNRFDSRLADAVTEYKRTHGLTADSVVDAQTVESLNRGADHYEKLILVNLERARALPADERRERYVLVDGASARLWLYENGQAKDSMKVIVGSKVQETPMLAALIRYAEVNPYWNVPPDLVQRLIAPRVLSEGDTYLRDRRYEVLSDWTTEAQPVGPDTVDWQAVAEGRESVRVRQLPGEANSMGAIKFMMPNEFGIYLHDTPNKAPFEQDDRWISNGCIRLEDAPRFARWLFGEMPQPASRDMQEEVQLAEPVPVYITYLTAAPASNQAGVVFRADRYDRDASALARFFGGSDTLQSAARE